MIRIENIEALMQASFLKFFFEPSCNGPADDLSRGAYASRMMFNDSQRLAFHEIASYRTVCSYNAGYENKSANAPICFLLCVLYEKALVTEGKQKSAYPKDICMRK